MEKLDEKETIYMARLLIFEGIDGSGKSTQIEMLSNFLKSKKQTVFVTREPGEPNLEKNAENYF